MTKSIVAAAGLLASLLIGFAGQARADADDLCARVRNDDRLRPYDPARRPAFVRAFKRLFPTARGGQSDAMLRAQGHFRCMDGKFFACFTGANLPCGKIDRSQTNRGAENFCRGNPNADIVPLAATGHGVEFNYRCRAGKAEIAGIAWTLDARGFAKTLWAPMDLD